MNAWGTFAVLINIKKKDEPTLLRLYYFVSVNNADKA